MKLDPATYFKIVWSFAMFGALCAGWLIGWTILLLIGEIVG